MSLAIDCASPPVGTRGVAYTHQMIISGGTGPYTVAVIDGFFVDGLTISNTALITGIPLFAGTSFFTLRVTDSTAATATVDCSISIGANPIFLGCASPPDGALGSPYSHQMALVGGSGPFFVQVYNGSLPPGLSISSLVLITGTPTSMGTFTFTVKVTESGALGRVTEVECSITIGPNILTLACGSPPVGTRGVPYSHQMTLHGGVAPYTVVVTAGVFPDGLSISSTALITGTPLFASTYIFTVRVTDAVGGTASVECSISFGAVDIYLDCANPPNGSVSSPYSHQMTLIGGSGPFFVQVYLGLLPSGPNNGILPPGLSIDSLVHITGVPTTIGTWSFTVKVTENGALGRSTEVACSITIGPGVISFTCASPPTGTRGQYYSHQMALSGGVAPYTVTVTAGIFPDGLSISNTALITGVPMFAATYIFTVTVIDSAAHTAAVQCSMSFAAVPILLDCASPPSGKTGVAYSHQMTLIGGSGPFFVQIYNGVLPPGLSISSLVKVTGIPTTVGSYTFTVKVTENGALGRATEVTCTIVITAGVVLSCASPPVGNRGVAYSHQMTLSGGVAPYTVAITAGFFVDGLSISNTALITGTPTFAGTYHFTVRATDSVGAVGFVDCAISIGAVAIFLDCASPPEGAVGVDYEHQMTLVGGSGPFFVQVYMGTLPPGLEIDPVVMITGVPAVAGTFPFRVKVTETGALGRATEVDCSITIRQISDELTCEITISGPLQADCNNPPLATVNVAYSHQIDIRGGEGPYTVEIVRSLDS